MRIISMLDLSTAHLPPQLRTAAESEVVGWYPTLCGGFLWVPDDPADVVTDGPEILAVRTFARAQRCDYILFDRDADEVDGVPTFPFDDDEVVVQ